MENNFESKRKMISIVLILVAVVVIVVMAVYFLGNKNNNQANVVPENTVNYVDNGVNKVNTSTDLAKDKKVGDVLIEKNALIYEGGVSKLTSKVTNGGAAIENLRFKVKFIANDGTVIAESVAYIGSIKTNETRYVNSDITLDVSNAKELVYELM